MSPRTIAEVYPISRHLIIVLRLDVARSAASSATPHVTTTLDIYHHIFDEARHSLDLQAQMGASAFADLLDRGAETGLQGGSVVTLPRPCEGRQGRLSAKERAALRWAT